MKGMGMHLRYETTRTLCRQLEHAGFEGLRVHWLPMAPTRWPRMQRVLETAPVRTLLQGVSPVGSLVSHSFVVRAQRGNARPGTPP
jgi:hypothetical protein